MRVIGSLLTIHQQICQLTVHGLANVWGKSQHENFSHYTAIPVFLLRMPSWLGAPSTTSECGWQKKIYHLAVVPTGLFLLDFELVFCGSTEAPPSIITYAYIFVTVHHKTSLKIRILPWSIVSGLMLCVQACLAAPGLITCVCAVAVTQRRLENPVGCKLHVTKTTNYYLLLRYYKSHSCVSGLIHVLHEYHVVILSSNHCNSSGFVVPSY